MKLIQSNIQTGILVLLVIIVGIMCIALFVTNKEVRNLKIDTLRNRNDIEALQNMLTDVGMGAMDSCRVLPSEDVDNASVEAFEQVGASEPMGEPVVSREPMGEPVVSREPMGEPVVSREPMGEPVGVPEPTSEPVSDPAPVESKAQPAESAATVIPQEDIQVDSESEESSEVSSDSE
jgi:hypothetical protein